MPRSDHATLLKATAQCGRRRPVGDLFAIGFFRLPRGVPRILLSEAYQSQMQVGSVKPNNVCRGRGKTYYFGARTRVLVQYNLQHKDYDNSLVKDNCWKENAGEVHAHGKEQATQYFVQYRKAYRWHAFV